MPVKNFTTMDGNTAAAHVAYEFSEIAAIYPITPSSTMPEKTDLWSALGRKNMFGQTVSLVEMQSEAGAIAAVHGALQTGSLAVSFTSSQGLMLMIPVLHRIAGELLPCVLHVASRTVGTHALSIFGDHSDVMNCRQTGFAMLCTGSVQEVMDLAGLAHLAAIHSRIPFLHFFDGFRTSHELCKIEKIDTNALAALLDRDALARFRTQALTPEHPKMRGTVQNDDVFFQIREASNRFYEALPDEVEALMHEISKITEREYHLFNYYGDPNAEEVVIAMGSVCGCACDAVDWLRAHGRKVGFLQVHLYRPFSARHLVLSLPSTVKRIAVLDRCKEPGAAGEPLYQDVCTSLSGQRNLLIIGGRYGLSSKDTDSSLIRDVFENLHSPDPKNGFTIGINDDVTLHSLPQGERIDSNECMLSCKFWGLGSDGTVGANRSTVDIVNSITDLYAQAYFEFDAKKSYGITKSHLRFSRSPIRTSSLIHRADIVACHNETYVGKYSMTEELKEHGIFLLNCSWKDDQLEARLPALIRRDLAQKHARLFIINASEIAHDLGLGPHVNNILQAAFFRIADIIPLDQAIASMEKAIQKNYFSKGETIVEKNLAALKAGITCVREVPVPEHWKNACAEPSCQHEEELPAVVKNLLIPINAQKGNQLPVSAFLGYEDGQMDMGLTAYEKRDIAIRVPQWNAQTCIQCNKCSFVCPHSVIRPYLMTSAESAAAPADLHRAPAKGKAAQGYDYTLQISVPDCTGCGCCVQNCPVSAISMIPKNISNYSPTHWKYVLSLPEKPDVFDPFTVKGSQFRQPLLEFSAACAGCGETPYAKLLTQLFGSRIYWANATGCSQAWGAAMPGIPYTTNKKGQGPAWSNSLFENNAEFCLGMLLAERQQREGLKKRVESFLDTLPEEEDLARAARLWLETFDDFDASAQHSENFANELERNPSPLTHEILQCKQHLAKKCFWMYGGDGWAYDIGFGGLDHVLASGEDINVLVIDTEVYSNTGGQSSKATPMGAVAKFCVSGKKSNKKDLGGMFMSYGNIYIAQVSMGADPHQLMTALKEASSYHGPSLIIAYTPCQSHGIHLGMDRVQQEMKRATDAGYWPLYRFDPRKDAPFILDSPAPSLEYLDFLRGEGRYASLEKTFPNEAKYLFEESRSNAIRRYARYASQSQTHSTN